MRIWIQGEHFFHFFTRHKKEESSSSARTSQLQPLGVFISRFMTDYALKGTTALGIRKARDPARIGLTAHTAIMHKLVSMGFEVLQSPSDDLRYDLAYYIEETEELIRIKCKAGRYDPDRGCIFFNNFSRPGGRGKKHGYVGDAECFGVYCEVLDKVYLIPIDIAPYVDAVGLRVRPTKNNQQKKVIWARDYEI